MGVRDLCLPITSSWCLTSKPQLLSRILFNIFRAGGTMEKLAVLKQSNFSWPQAGTGHFCSAIAKALLVRRFLLFCSNIFYFRWIFSFREVILRQPIHRLREPSSLDRFINHIVSGQMAHLAPMFSTSRFCEMIMANISCGLLSSTLSTNWSPTINPTLWGKETLHLPYARLLNVYIAAPKKSSCCLPYRVEEWLQTLPLHRSLVVPPRPPLLKQRSFFLALLSCWHASNRPCKPNILSSLKSLESCASARSAVFSLRVC